MNCLDLDRRMPRGRPSAPTVIVEVDKILGHDNILRENWAFFDLCIALGEPIAFLKSLSKRRLIKNNLYCKTCRLPFGLNAYKSATDGYRWFFKNCKKRQSAHEGSFFSKSRLPLKQLLLYIHSWSRNVPQADIQYETGIQGSATLADWGNFCRDVCEPDIEENPQIIGGINVDGTPIVVEIDESKFFHRKYHCGQWRPGHWVFGGMERNSHRCFLCEVPDRTARTIRELILEYILPGAHIVSDRWASYAGTENTHDGIYSHEIIIHQQHFVNPLNNEVHTQNVENMWMRLKRKLRQQFGTSEALSITPA